jgi:hypothetical protein
MILAVAKVVTQQDSVYLTDHLLHRSTGRTPVKTPANCLAGCASES